MVNDLNKARNDAAAAGKATAEEQAENAKLAASMGSEKEAAAFLAKIQKEIDDLDAHIAKAKAATGSAKADKKAEKSKGADTAAKDEKKKDAADKKAADVKAKIAATEGKLAADKEKESADAAASAEAKKAADGKAKIAATEG